MRVPDQVAAKLREIPHLDGIDGLNFRCDESGHVLDWQKPVGTWGLIYPPLGYIEWGMLAVGNGDSYGYYWPIGREDCFPLVCRVHHDSATLWPVASSIPTLLRSLSIWQPWLGSKLLDAAETLDVEIGDLGIPADDEEAEAESGSAWLSAFPEDPKSPFLLVEQARLEIKQGVLEAAAEHLQDAVSLLPEYTEAHSLLAGLRRRLRDANGEVDELLEAATSLDCFRGDFAPKEAISKLQRIRDDKVESRDDPLWRNRQRLNADMYKMTATEYGIYEDAIEFYHQNGMGLRAVRLRMALAEMTERVSDKSGWTVEGHVDNLRRDMERAGLHDRLSALERYWAGR